MKNKIVILFVLSAYGSMAQVSVLKPKIIYHHTLIPLNNLSKHQKEELLNRFKNTTTIFSLSNIYNPEQYDSILKKAWHVTPYRVVYQPAFNMDNYLDGKYSFARLTYFVIKDNYNGIIGINPIIGFYVLREKEFKEHKAKWENKWRKKLKEGEEPPHAYYRQLNNIFYKYSDPVAYIFLSVQDVKYFAEFGNIVRAKQFQKKSEILYDYLYNKPVIYNYRLGYLKNYFQEVNDYLDQGKDVFVADEWAEKDLSRLKTDTLYIPQNVFENVLLFKKKNIPMSKSEIGEIMSAYPYPYKIISPDELDKKILNDEDIYYLRFVFINTDRSTQVVNAKTGKVVYSRYYGISLKPKIKKKHMANIANSIKTAHKVKN